MLSSNLQASLLSLGAYGIAPLKTEPVEKKTEKFTLDADGNLIDASGNIVKTERVKTELKVSLCSPPLFFVCPCPPPTAQMSHLLVSLLRRMYLLWPDTQINQSAALAPKIAPTAAAAAAAAGAGMTATGPALSMLPEADGDVVVKSEAPKALFVDPRMLRPKTGRRRGGLQFIEPGTFIKQAQV